MKKILFSFVVVLISLFVITQHVNAEESNAIITEVNQTIKISGKSYKFKESFITDVENYLEGHKLSDNDITYIADHIDEIIEIYKASGVSKWANLPEEERPKVNKYIEEINTNTKVTVSLNEDGVVTVYNKEQELFQVSNLFEEIEVEETKKEEKDYTGNPSNMFIIIGGTAFAILLIVTRNVVKTR